MTKLKEDFSAKHAEKGQVKFLETKIDDAHIKKMVADISKKSGVSVQSILDGIHKAMAKFSDLANKAPILYATCQRNIVENEIFNLVEEASKKGYGLDAPVKYDFPTFNALFARIRSEHDQFFPLRNFIDHKTLHNPIVIIVPSAQKDYKKYNKIDTAAATPTGQFIFNKVFMQNLLDFAYYKGLKPKGKKYISNGGKIPDEYAYIEFLIIHELMHYAYADFHYKKILKAKNKIINWVGDFRSNYLLVKSGYEQLPMGLFNDEINYDRQKTYREMYEKVKEEFDKLSVANQALVNKTLGEIEGGSHGTAPDNGKNVDKPEYKEGQMVTNPSGKIRIIKTIHPDGKIDVRELTPDEKKRVEDSFKNHGILGIPQHVKDGLK